MVNAFRNFDNDTKWVQFVVAGIGGERINLDATSVTGADITYNESDTVFSYQAGAFH
jgi:hypothetical protein